jgi:hypothetical protein
MLAGAALQIAGAALLHTFLAVDTSTPTWAGLEFLAGAGAGFAAQQGMLAVQAVLPAADIPLGTGLVVFSQTLGASVFLAISQAVFDSKLISGLTAALPDGSSDRILADILNSGAADLASAVPAADLPGVLDAYSRAVTMPFVVSAAIAGVALLGSTGMEWVSVKGKNLMAGPPEP